MNAIRHVLSIFMLLLGPVLLAQSSATGSIAGRVTDAKSRLALGGARVMVAGTALETFAGQSGDYVLVNVPAGGRSVMVSYVGYPDATQLVTVAAGGVATADVAVGESTVRMEKFVIEGSSVGAELGYVYYSDEQHGVHKYRADPEAADAGQELALLGTTGFASDHEGISIYSQPGGVGYVIVSNQQADTFRIFPRAGTGGKPHDHPLLKSVRLSTHESDGSEVTNVALPGFPGGLLVAMSTDRTFHFYAWDDIAAAVGWK